MWWTRNFCTIEAITDFLNLNKIEKMQIIYINDTVNPFKYTLVYFTENY